jgi:malonyl-CoA/methylmalonyl-CoA synthetase
LPTAAPVHFRRRAVYEAPMSANLWWLLRESFDAAMDGPAIVRPDGTALGYRGLDDLSARFAAVLRTRGVAAGDRVVVQADKSEAVVALYLACLRTGAVLVPLNTAYTAAEVAAFLADAEPKLFVAAAREESSGGGARVPASTQADAPGVATVLLGTDLSSPLWAEALDAEPDERVAPRDADDLAAMVYTSGTTGRSKGAMLTHGNLSSNARTLHVLWGFRPDDVLLHALPVYHVHGLFVALHCAMLSGAPMLFLPKFDAGEVRRRLPQATVMMGVPTFYTRLLALPEFSAEDCRGVRLFVSGSAPLPAETWREFRERSGHEILERYGMTETGMITSNPLEGRRAPGTVGFPLPEVEVRIVRDDGAVCAAGETGVLEVRGPNVFRGYWKLPERTAAEFRDGGWFVTGDLATRDVEGRVTLVGRARDLIICGGLNVYPKEIEEILDGVEGVAESAVIGVPDADFGEAVVAVVVPKAGAVLSVDLLMQRLRERLARFKHPRRIEIAAALPRNAMGKVQKNLLRDEYGKMRKNGV